LDKESINITCPVVLVQGMKDSSINWHKALEIARLVKSENVIIKLLKNANHRLNEDADIKEILSGLDTFL